MNQTIYREQPGHLGTQGDAQLSGLLDAGESPRRLPAVLLYVPKKLDRLAKAVLARAILDVQQGEGTKGNQGKPSQRQAEAAYAWLQETEARAWLDELDYPLDHLDRFLIDAGREILARRIVGIFTAIEKQKAREEEPHAQQDHN